MWTYPGNIQIAHRHMNVKIGTEAEQLPEKEYINEIFVAVRGGENDIVHRKKKVREFPVPSRDVTTKLSLGGNNDVIIELFLPRGSLVNDIPAGDGKLVILFLRCTC
jgi:hypothetical protein